MAGTGTLAEAALVTFILLLHLELIQLPQTTSASFDSLAVRVAEIDGLRFQMKRLGNDTYYATLIQDSQHRALVRHYHSTEDYDDSGALYYVIAVVLIYGLSIVLMIASHIKKNKLDGHISIYLKEIAFVRKQTRRDQLMVKVNSPNLQERSSKDGNSSPNMESVFTPLSDDLSCTSKNDSESPRDLTPGSACLAVKEPGTRFPFNTPQQQQSSHVRFEDERQRLLVPRTPSPVSRRHQRQTRPTSPVPGDARRNSSKSVVSERRRSTEKRDGLAPLILRYPRINIENSSDDSEGVAS